MLRGNKITGIVRENKRIIALLLVLPLLAAVADSTNNYLTEDNKIKRDEPGKSNKVVELVLNGEGLEDNYKYSFELLPEQLSEKEIEEYFKAAEEEIDSSVFGDEKADCVTEGLTIKELYCKDLVEAEWTFSDYSLIDSQGQLIRDNISSEGQLLFASVTLTCQQKEEVYEFPIKVYPHKLTKQESILEQVDLSIEKSMEETGETLLLPSEAEGVSLKWSEKKRHTVAKVLVFELIIVILFVLMRREKDQQARKKRELLMKYDYSDIISKMAILVGSGMTIKESWNRIATRYSTEREKKQHPAFVEMQITVNEMKDGISEKVAYQRFGERSGLGEYHRFSRSLVQNLQKGNRGICEYLEKEAAVAYEEKKLLAKKYGEEAGTKLLGPLMLMMAVVIAIVIVPAMVSFTI